MFKTKIKIITFINLQPVYFDCSSNPLLYPDLGQVAPLGGRLAISL